MPILNLIRIGNGGHMELRSDKKFFKRTSNLILIISSVIVIATCAYYGFKISGISGAGVGASIGLVICLS